MVYGLWIITIDHTLSTKKALRVKRYALPSTPCALRLKRFLNLGQYISIVIGLHQVFLIHCVISKFIIVP